MSTVSDNISFDEATNTLTVNPVDGVQYLINGKPVTGEVKLTKNTTVRARPEPGFVFARGTQREYKYEVNKGLVEQERASAIEESKAARTAARATAKAAEPVATERDNPRNILSGDRPAVNPTAETQP